MRVLAGCGSIGSPSYHSKIHPGHLCVIDLCYCYCFMCGCNGPRVSVHTHTQMYIYLRTGIDFCTPRRMFLLFLSALLVCYFVNSTPEWASKRTLHRAAPRWQWCTAQLPQGRWGGWVHTVNYTSHPLVWFIALITVSSLKKEKGEEAYKIKKKKDWKCHSDKRGEEREGELCVSACGGHRSTPSRHCLLL